MARGKKTLYEMHEMAKTKGRKFERVVASAGNGQGDLGETEGQYMEENDYLQSQYSARSNR